MLRVLAILFPLLLLFATLVCSAEQQAAESRPSADGQAVVNYLTKTEPYQSWPLWPGREKLYQGQHPHGAYLTTYVSPGAYAAIQKKAGTIPNGEFIVKENYTREKELAAITVMYKKKGYDPAAGDWFWLKFKPAGSIEKAGKVGGCIGCHAAVKRNDWLFTGPLQ